MSSKTRQDRQSHRLSRPYRDVGRYAPGRILRVMHQHFKGGVYGTDLADVLLTLDEKGVVSKTKVMNLKRRLAITRWALAKLMDNGEILFEVRPSRRYVLSPLALKLAEERYRERKAYREAQRSGWAVAEDDSAA